MLCGIGSPRGQVVKVVDFIKKLNHSIILTQWVGDLDRAHVRQAKFWSAR